MKTEKQIWKRSRHLVLAAGVLLLGGSFMTSCTDQYDLDERTPSGWDGSIYNWLEKEGNYTNTVRLIDDLGYHDVLAKTGSKTLFVADDAAYERFYRNNSWGVSDYNQLTNAQKRFLLYGNMIGNSIQLNDMANVQGNPPKVGECMRRFSDIDPLDSVPLMTIKDFPDNPYWADLREANETIPCLTDGTQVPQVQLIDAQLRHNRITDDDYNWLFNNTVERKPLDASVNGVQVETPNIRCANGFLHKTKEVVIPLPNMAELIAKKPQLSTFNKMLERFCAPYPDREGSQTDLYNYTHGTNVAKIYYKRFLSLKSKDGKKLNQLPDLKYRKDDELLKFDPEWNAYYSANNKSDTKGYTEEQRDMAVMMVPTNEAMDKFFKEGPLKETYASWEDVPDNIITKLINNNMLASFIQSVPSKFSTILNDANDPMGVTKDGIDSVWLACNGAVYATNVVYTPTAYVSVYFPAFINEDMKIIDWGIRRNQYNVYLNALGTTYSFFIPTHNSLKEYIDPCSYGKSKLQLLSLEWDDTPGLSDEECLYANLYDYDPVTGQKEFVKEVRDNYRMKNILKDILDTHIVIGDVEDGNTYYRTKGGTEIRVTNPQLRDHGMTVEGSYQVNEGKKPLEVKKYYDQTKKTRGGNGMVYVLDNEQPIMGTTYTVDEILGQHEEFSAFRELLEGCPGILGATYNPSGKDGDEKACGGNNISLFNTYHYTIYVPTNESIKKLQDEGKLSSWDKVAANTDATSRRADSLRIERFLRYHIQDNALFIGAEPQNESDYETSLLSSKSLTPRFYKLKVELTDKDIIIKDEVDKKNGTTSHKVKTDNPNLMNLQAREYIYNSADANTAEQLYTTSSAVIHLIDSPLEYDPEY